MRKHLILSFTLLTVLFMGCEKAEEDCGSNVDDSYLTYSNVYFSQPSEIYWGVSGGKRSFTYNWTITNICTKENPKVYIKAVVDSGNNTRSNPFSFEAGIQTCIGVQAQKVTLVPDSEQKLYTSNTAEIGMNQCFGGKSSATIYPYITVSFTTLGSSAADSLYLLTQLSLIVAHYEHKEPK